MDLDLGEILKTLHASQARQALILDLLQGQRHTSDPEEIMRAAATAIGRHLAVDRAGFFEVLPGGFLEYSTGWTAGHLPLLVQRFPATALGTPYLAEFAMGSTLAISDVHSNHQTADSLFPELGTSSLIGVPILRDDRWLAGFYVHHASVRHWSDDEIELVRNVGELTWDAIQRVRAARALRTSEERFTLALHAGGGVGTWDWDVPRDRVYSDAPFAALFSVDPRRAAAGTPISDYLAAMHPDDREQVREKIQFALENDPDYTAEFRIVGRDGGIRWVLAQGRCHRDASGTPLRFPGVVIDITLRKHAEIGLHKQWNTFDTALSHTPVSTYIFDLDGRFTYANRSLLLRYQKNLDEVLGRDFFDLGYPPEQAAKFKRQLQHVIHSKSSFRGQTQLPSGSGETRAYEYVFVPVIGESGHVEAVAGSTHDVTERSRAEVLVERDRSRWRDLLFHAPAGIAVLHGPGHRFDWVNLEYTRLLQREAGALLGKTVVEALPEVEGQIYVGLLDNVYNTGEPFVGHESPLRLTRTDGSSEDIFVTFVYAPTRDDTGRIDGIFVHVTEVTAAVRSRQRVQESEQRFRQLADSMPQLIWTARPDGTLDYCNERWYEFTGFDRSLPENQSWDALLHPEEKHRVHDTWLSCVRSGESYRTELRFWDRQESRWRWFMSRAVAVRGADGGIAKWFGTSIDIDEQKASQQALLQTQKLESVGLLAGGIAHDFNNLLVGIMGGASFALETIAPLHPAHAMLQNVVDASERAAHLTRQMLAYAGKGRFIIEPLNLSEMVVQTIQLVSASIPKSVSIKLELDDHLLSVETDPGQMQQVVMNLIINAAEAVGEKPGSVTARTRTEHIPPGVTRRSVDGALIAPGPYAVLEVQDTGAGIEPSALGKICDPFFTTKFAGRGLGLAAVSGVVRSHQGGLEVESQVGVGSTFRVLLPASKARTTAAAPPAHTGGGQARETVLVMDDEPVVRHVAKATLEKSGYSVIVAENAGGGIEEIRRNPAISLVLLDMNMPGLNGRQALELIQTIRPQLPVVICSGYSENEVYQQFSGLEIAGVLPKPFTASRLSSQTRAVLDDSRPLNRP